MKRRPTIGRKAWSVMGDKQKWFMLAAAICMTVVVGLEIGSSFMISAASPSEAVVRRSMDREGIDDDEQDEAIGQLNDVADAADPPGLAIPALAAIDGLLLLSIAGLALALFVPHRITAKVVAPVNLIASIIVIILSIIVIITTIVLLFLMTGLFLAAPFGTITYLVRWGFFPRGDAQFLLGLLLFFKLVFVVSVFLAAPRMVKDKGLVLMVVTSIVLQLIVGFLHAFVPLPLVSIVDAVAAIVVFIVAVIWAIIILIGSLIGTLRLVRTARVHLPSGA